MGFPHFTVTVASSDRRRAIAPSQHSSVDLSPSDSVSTLHLVCSVLRALHSHRLRKLDATVHGNAFKVNESSAKKPSSAAQHMKELNQTEKNPARERESSEGVKKENGGEKEKNGGKKSV